MRVDHKLGPPSEPSRLLLTPVFGSQQVGRPGVVGVDGFPVIVLVPQDGVELLPGVLWLYLTAEVGGVPGQQVS